jgi:hypothetical protein
MTTLKLKLELPDRLVRDAKSAGLLTQESIARLLKDAVRLRAGKMLIEAANQAARAGGEPPSMEEIVADVKAVRAARKKTSKRK